MQHLLFGAPPIDLAPYPSHAQQVSPFLPGSASLESIAPASVDSCTIFAPAGTIERRYTLALALRALKEGGILLALAPKDKGGSRIAGDLKDLGAEVEEDSKRHHRICRVAKNALSTTAVEEAIAAGAPRYLESLRAWTQPGVFSWDRLDAGSALLLDNLPAQTGRGADLGAGLGFLTRELFAKSTLIKHMDLYELDRRSVELAAKNVIASRTTIHWADVRKLPLDRPGRLDFVITNPPFHDGGAEDRSLGLAFLRAAAALLRGGGSAWIVANRHLPYEAALNEHFSRSELLAEAGGFKVYRAEK